MVVCILAYYSIHLFVPDLMKGFNFFTEITYLEFVFHRSSDIRFKFYCQNDANILLKFLWLRGLCVGLLDPVEP